MHLVAIAGAAQVFAPGRFLRVTNEIRSGNMVMVPKFGGREPAKVITNGDQILVSWERKN